MIKLFEILFSITLIIFFVFGFLILLEYMKFWKRKLVVKLRYKLKKGVAK